MSGAEPFMIAAAAASAAGDMVQGISAYQGASYSARALRQQAIQAREDANSQAQLGLEEDARTISSGIVAAAKGGGLNGSAMDVLGDLARQSYFDARRASVEGLSAGNALEAEARQVKKEGTFALIGSTLKAGSTVMGAGMRARERSQQRRTMNKGKA